MAAEGVALAAPLFIALFVVLAVTLLIAPAVVFAVARGIALSHGAARTAATRPSALRQPQPTTVRHAPEAVFILRPDTFRCAVRW
jgi:hypothetical protein